MKTVVKYYFKAMLIISILVINFLFFKSDIAGNYLFPQGDTNFYVVNLRSGHSEKIFEAHSLYITGATYITINNTHYLAYVVGHEQERAVFNSTFTVMDISDYSTLYEFNLPFYPYDQNGSVIYNGLAVLYMNNQITFMTLIEAGTSQTNSISNLFQFSINGSDFKFYHTISQKFPEAVIRDVSYYNGSSLLTLSSLYKSENFDLGAHHILWSNLGGKLTHIADLEHNAIRISYENTSGSIFLSYKNKQFIEQRYLNGTILHNYNVGISTSEIRAINSSTVLISEYVQKFQHIIIAGLIVTIVFGVIPICLENSEKIMKWLTKNPKMYRV